MPGDDALHGREADAVAGEFRFDVQALEYAEQFAGIPRVGAGAAVAHVEQRTLVPLFGAEFDLRRLAITGESSQRNYSAGRARIADFGRNALQISSRVSTYGPPIRSMQ